MRITFAPVLLPVLVALGFLLTASKCERHLDFPPYVAEICTDTQDNDGDGLVDCLDSDCDQACGVRIVLFPPTATITGDTLTVQGTHENAASVSVTVRPSGRSDAASISGSSWQATLRDLTSPGTYTVTALAISQQGKRDSAGATFQRGN